MFELLDICGVALVICSSRKAQDELTGNIEVENFLFLHSSVNQFLAGLIHHQNFPLLGGGCRQYPR